MTLMVFAGSSPAKNLKILSKTTLDNFELLDVYLNGNLAYIPAGLGGLNIVDISDPASPQVLSSYRASGCDWGRVYAWAADNNYAYGVGRDCGVHILNVTNPEQPSYLATHFDASESERRYEHAELLGSRLYLARHQQGVEIVDVSNPISTRTIGVIPSQNAWATLATDDLLFIADGAAGVKIVDLRNATPGVIGSIQTSGTAKDLALSNNRLFVAVGAAGVDMIDVSIPANPILIDNYNTTGYASRVSASNGRLAVSDWDDVEILEYLGDELSLVGYKNTGGRVMALASAGDLIISAEWRLLTIFEFGDVLAADIDLETKRLEFPRTLSSVTDTLPLRIQNSGSLPLQISNVEMNNSDFSVLFPSQTIAAGSSMEAQVVYQPGVLSWQGALVFDTNDPDEERINIKFQGNHPYGPMVGDEAPPFELESVNGYGTITNETYLGRPVVMAFFTAW